jgi:hypothetical protein
MKKYFITLAALGFSGLAYADQSWQPTPVDLNDLDHTRAYTWKITAITVAPGQTITGAKLFFDNIRNWDSSHNSLFIHLLDTASNSGVASFQDSSSGTISDNFAGSSYGSNPLVSHPEPGNTLLTTYVDLPATAQDLPYTFTAAQLSTLKSYIANGADIAFGIDPDCHYYNDGITFTLMTSSTVPEPGSILLLGTVAAGVLYRLRKRRTA